MGNRARRCPASLSAPRPPRQPLAVSAAATAWADGWPCAGAEPRPRCSLHRLGESHPRGLPAGASALSRLSALRGPPSALRARMAELRPNGAPGPAVPPAPGPTAPPAFASLFPPGLHAIYGECRRLYPDQPNPLQVTAIVKYWYALDCRENDRAGWGGLKHWGRSNIRGRWRRMVKALGRRASCCERRSCKWGQRG